MPTHNPVPCAYSTMSQRGTDELVLLNTGSYPGFSTYLNATYTWNGTDWTLASSALIDGYTGPTPVRSNQVMAYDGTNVMVFGGQGGNGGVFNDTWTWDGTAPWTKQSPATSPFGRYDAKAAYLDGYGAVMFGGFGGAGNGVYLNETWIWSGTTWTLQSSAGCPSARIGHCMAASSSEVLMFGGVNPAGQYLLDTWTFNGSAWTKVAMANGAGPSSRANACMSYDSVNSLWVMFGGVNQYNYLPETWTFNGTAWTKVAMANGAGPLSPLGAQMCFDTQSGKTLLFGGISSATNLASNQTWAFDGSALTWTQL